MNKRHSVPAGSGVVRPSWGGLHLHPGAPPPTDKPETLALLEPTVITEATTFPELQRIIGSHTDRYNELARRLNAGRYVSQDEFEVVRQSEDKALKALDDLRAQVNALGGNRLHGWQPDGVTLMRAAMILEPDEEFKGIDRTYFNLMSLYPEELAGLVAIGARGAPGVAVHARNMAKAIQSAPSIQRHARLQQLNDHLYIKDYLLSCTNEAYKRARLHGIENAMRTLQEWKEWEQLSSEFNRALNEGTGTAGGHLVPVILSTRIGDIKELMLKVVSLFPRFTMTSKTFDWPFLGSHITVYTPGEGTSDHAAYQAGITAGSPAYTKPVWTANKLAGLTFMSTELDEDAITPMMAWLEGEMGRSLAHGEENAYVNGEKAGSTMDGATFNPENSDRRYVNGLRYHALMTGSYPATTDAGNAALTNAMGIGLQQKMGVWGVMPETFAWITGYRAYHSLRLIQDFWTLEKLGPQAVLLTGQVGQWLGSPAIRSEKVVDLNAAGKYDGTTTNRGSIIGVDRSRWATGDRRTLTINTSEHVAFRSDQVGVRGTQRGDFQPLDIPAATITPVGLIFNIA